MPYIRKRGDTFSFTIDIGKDMLTRKRKQKTVGGFKSEKEALRAAVSMEKEYEEGRRPENLTVKEYFEHYLENAVKPTVEEMTHHAQMQACRHHIYPSIGHLKLNKVTFEHIEALYKKLLDSGLGRGMIRHIAMVLRKVFRSAAQRQYIVTNPAQIVKVPSYTPPRMKVWKKENVVRFLEIAKDSPCYILYVISLSTGMRLGEMLALTWDDVNWEYKTIAVNKSLKYSVYVGLVVKEPKTKNSKRTIRIPQYAVDALLEHKSKQVAGVDIIVDKFGGYHIPSDVSRRFVNDCKRLGMPIIRFHDMRHTHATLLFHEKFNAKVIAERLGDRVETIMNTYSHVLPDMQEEVINRLDDIL